MPRREHLEPSPLGRGQGEGITGLLGGASRKKIAANGSSRIRATQQNLKVPSPRPSPKGRGRKSQTIPELRALQRLTGEGVFRRLTPAMDAAPKWRDGRPARRVIASFIKPNDRLSSFERLEIYNRQYWFRILDALWDDFPGLRAVLGDKTFHRMSQAYLARYPSRTFTMRDLGYKLEAFLTEEPRWAGRHAQLAIETARFEWAEVLAFDGPSLQPITPDDLLGRHATRLRLRLQPYITLLESSFPIDEFLLSLKKKSPERGDASQAMEESAATKRRSRRAALPKREKTFVAVHRLEHSVYYKRLEPVAFRLVEAIRDGQTVQRACVAALELASSAHEDENETNSGDWASKIQQWFKTWTTLGWFASRSRRVG